MGFEIISTVDVARAGVDAAVERIRGRVGDSPVYVSIDIDVLDPAHAPGTGTPEPGGLTTREMMLILRGMAGSAARRRRRGRGRAAVRPRGADGLGSVESRLRAARDVRAGGEARYLTASRNLRVRS